MTGIQKIRKNAVASFYPQKWEKVGSIFGGLLFGGVAIFWIAGLSQSSNVELPMYLFILALTIGYTILAAGVVYHGLLNLTNAVALHITETHLVLQVGFQYLMIPWKEIENFGVREVGNDVIQTGLFLKFPVYWENFSPLDRLLTNFWIDREMLFIPLNSFMPFKMTRNESLSFGELVGATELGMYIYNFAPQLDKPAPRR